MRHAELNGAGGDSAYRQDRLGVATPKPKELRVVVDYSFLSSLLKKSRSNDAYVRSALYYAFTGRKQVWLLGEGIDTIILLPHPNALGSILVFFPFAHDINSFSQQVPSLCKLGEFLSAFDHVFLARIPQFLVESALRARTEISVGRYMLRKTRETVLDWAYPSYDVCLAKLVQPIGRELATYRKKVRKFDNRGVELINLDVERPEQVRAVIDISARWIWTKSQRLASHPERRSLLHEMLDPYRCLASLSGIKELDIDGFILKRGNENLAFSFWEKPRTPSEPVACMAALPSSHEMGLSEYLYCRIAQTLHGQGYKTMCIGGSETAELDHFKRKLAPISPYHHLRTLELDFHEPPCQAEIGAR